MSANKRINNALVKVNRYAITSLTLGFRRYGYLFHEMSKEVLILVESTYLLLLLLLLHLYSLENVYRLHSNRIMRRDMLGFQSVSRRLATETNRASA